MSLLQGIVGRKDPQTAELKDPTSWPQKMSDDTSTVFISSNNFEAQIIRKSHAKRLNGDM